MTLLALRDGGKRALAAALADLERDPEGEKAQALLDAAWREPKAHVVGVTGPPGVGKSSLCAALVAAWRKAGKTVGVIAVDPSSKSSGGALLGDRVRIVHDSTDEGSFVRSMAARDRLGGLADQTLAAMVVMRALFDRVLIETVGVGQSETDVAGVADTVVFCVQPGSGVSLQFMKAGIVEIPHLIVVTKADLGAAAERARADVAGALSLATAGDEWPVKTLAVSSRSGTGIDAWLKESGSKRYLTSCCGKSRQSFVFYSDARGTPTQAKETIRLAFTDCLAMMGAMQAQSGLFKATGGVHNAALFDQDGSLLLSRVDIGRHNALDKIYGHCLRAGMNMEGKILAFSGRVSSEVLVKAAKMRCEVLLSKSAATDLALELADQLGISGSDPRRSCKRCSWRRSDGSSLLSPHSFSSAAPSSRNRRNGCAPGFRERSKPSRPSLAMPSRPKRSRKDSTTQPSLCR
jgi:LAO/AO transport system kinase